MTSILEINSSSRLGLSSVPLTRLTGPVDSCGLLSWRPPLQDTTASIDFSRSEFVSTMERAPGANDRVETRRFKWGP